MIENFLSINKKRKIEKNKSYLNNILEVYSMEDGIIYKNNDEIIKLTHEQLRNFDIYKHHYLLNFEKFTTEQKIFILSKSCNYKYDFSDVIFHGVDDIIKPLCPDHGYFVTTPRKLIFKEDKCKWCDGIDYIDINNEISLEYKLNRENRINEKLYIYQNLHLWLEQLKLENEYISFKDYTPFHITKYINPNIIFAKHKLVSFKDIKNFYIQQSGSKQTYKDYLIKIKNQENNNSIFYKVNLIDSSSKFQFCAIGYLFPDIFKINNINLIDKSDDEIQEFVEKILKLYFPKFILDIQYIKCTNHLRNWLLYNQYIEENKNKYITLPNEINDKLAIYFKQENKPLCKFFWSESTWDSTQRSISLIRETLLNKTNICPICNKEIVSPVVDHEHKKKIKGSGRIRNNICSNCNVFIAKIENNCKRYNIELERLPEVLKNVSDYFNEQQYNIIHYTDKEDNRVKISKNEISKILKYWTLLYPKRKFPSRPKSGYLTKDWEEYKEKLDEYLKNPYKPFNKKQWSLLKTKMESVGMKCPEYSNQKHLNVITPEISKLFDRFNIL